MNYPIIVSLDQRYFDKEKHLFLKGSPVFESLTKDDRPYVEGTLVADEMNTYFVPFRSHVDPNFAKKHSEAVVTLRTKSKPDAGLDIRKMLVVGTIQILKFGDEGLTRNSTIFCLENKMNCGIRWKSTLVNINERLGQVKD